MIRIFRGWIAFLKRQIRVPEHSIPLRVSVGAVILLAISATASQLEWPDYAWAAFLLTPLGMVFSYRKRHRNNWEVKAVLSVLMLVTLARFFVALSTSVFDPRVPLAELLLWLQTLHSWDLPCRRDLNYSMAVGLTLMALAGVLSVNLSYGLFLVTYLLLGLVALHYSYLSMIGQECQVRLGRLPTPPLLRLSLGILAAGSLVFVLLPRTQSMRLRALPFSWQVSRHLTKGGEGEVLNPGYPSTRDPQKFRQRARFSGDSYFGFNSVVDLSLRGAMSDELVMRVRTSRWNYLRGMTFDHYDGQFWSLSDESVRKVQANNPPLYLPAEFRGSQENVQIYYVEKPQPNLIFAAPEPAQLYFPTDQVYLDTGRGIRSPYPLDEGTVYSVISYELVLSPEQIRRLPERDAAVRHLARYLQLPEVSQRVKDLTEQIVGGRHRSFEKASALCLYLQSHYDYLVDVPRYPTDAETADYFLFEQKKGYCEQFATAMTVMCRLAKLRARYVTGYLPGTYNPLTGYQEVHGSDAHAWVEVYIPNLGFVSFDPTPGASATPGLKPPEQDSWLIFTLLRYLGRKLGLHGSDLTAMARELRDKLGVPLWLLGLLAALGAISALRGLRWNRGPRGPREAVVKDYHAMLAWLARRGQARTPASTPREILARCDWPEVVRLTELFEAARYAPGPVSEESARASRQALRELRARRETGVVSSRQFTVPSR